MLTNEPSFASLLVKQSPAMHYGHGWIMRDRVSRKGPEVRYAERRLLGLNGESYVLTLDILNRFLLS